MNAHSYISRRWSVAARTVCILVAGFLCAVSGPALARDPRTIGIVADGEGFDREGLIREVVELTAQDFDVRFPEDKILLADWNPNRVDEELDRLLADPEVDLVIALGVIASQQATHRTNLPKPVVAPYVVDPVLQRTPLSAAGGSGRKNLTYLTYPNTMDRDLRALYALVPFRRVAVVVHGPFLEAVSELPPVQAAVDLGFAIDLVPVDGPPQGVVGRLDAKVDAVYLTPLPAIPPEAVRQLADKLVERRLPSFSMNGQAEVELGLFASLNDSQQVRRLTRRTAFAVQEILLGRDPSTMSVFLDPSQSRLSVNIATADALGIRLAPELQYEATLFGATQEASAELGLREAVTEALGANAGLKATTSRLQAADAERGRAAAAWLPQVTASAGLRIVDPDQVEASVGTLAEQTAVVGLTASQLVFSDLALANVAAQHDAAIGRSAELDAAGADLVYQVSSAWALVQRSGALLAVRVNDTRRVEQHLQVAMARRDVGSVTTAEVARWDAEVANAQRLVLDARTHLHQAEIALAWLLGRPTDQPIRAAVVDPNHLPTGFDEPELALLLGGDEQPSGRVAEWLVDTAIAGAPELRGLDAACEAQKHIVGAANRSSFLPTIGVGATVDRIYRSGPDRFALDLGIPGVPPYRFPAQPDVVWTVGATATLPLFSGGAGDADRREARDTATSLEQQRAWAEQSIERRVRSALAAATGSYQSLRLARRAADSADRTLEWATQAYATGLATQVALLDARNASLNASLAWTDAAFVLLGDLLELERATSRQHARMEEGEWTAFLGALPR